MFTFKYRAIGKSYYIQVFLGKFRAGTLALPEHEWSNFCEFAKGNIEEMPPDTKNVYQLDRGQLDALANRLINDCDVILNGPFLHRSEYFVDDEQFSEIVNRATEIINGG